MKINRTTPDYKEFLKVTAHIAKPPKSLYFIGKLPESRIPSVAIVGTRKPSSYGREVAHRFAFELAQKGIVIISGLALGTDSIAHRGTLEAGGTTIAVLANGLPEIYPATHADLGKQIVESGGAIISEYEPHSRARPYQFLERNRIVSALSDAVIIVEAAARSGTLNTAMHALEQGKDVFVVPGNITSPLSAGCNALLKQGAHPATCIEDILEIIAPNIETEQAQLPLAATPLEAKIIELLQAGVRDGDELHAQSSVPAAEFGNALTMMEINGQIRSLGANRWTLG